MAQDEGVDAARRPGLALSLMMVAAVAAGCSAAEAESASAPASPSPVPTALIDTPTPSPSTAASSSTTPTPTPTPSTPVSPLAATPSPAPPGSFVLGDSISLSIAPALSQRGFDVTGKVGQSASVEYLRTHLASPAAQEAAAWVVMLGTNNRGDESDLAELRSWIREIRTARESRPRQHVYWVTPHRPEDYRGGMSTHTLDALTAALRTEAARRPWLTVLDFDALAREHPEWFAQDGARLHPDAEGQAALVNLIAGPNAPLAETAGSIVEIPRPTPSPTAPEAADEPSFPAEEFSNE